MADQPIHRPHFVLHNTSKTEPYASPGRAGPKPPVPPQNRIHHAAVLREQLQEVAAAQGSLVAQQKDANLEVGVGIQVEFESFDSVRLATESLARDRSGIELMNVRKREEKVLATVFVPDGKLVHFERILTAYAEQETQSGQPKNQPLVDAIQTVRAATFESLWTDAPEALPADMEQPIWWEAWLPAGEHRLRTIDEFRRIAELSGMQTRDQAVHFPERSVVLMYGSQALILSSPLLLTAIAELRRAKDTAEFFDSLPVEDQDGWVDELLTRVTPGASLPICVTLLDTGVNIGHPLLTPHAHTTDLYSISEAWATDDTNGHGTQLAGLVMYGDLAHALESNHALEISHGLESVKVLRHTGDNQGEVFGSLTGAAVMLPEEANNDRTRVFAMAITARDGRDRGRPSSWSAAVDRLACDYDNQGEKPRLFVIAAGNSNNDSWGDYPASLSTDSIRDPGQAWNALTIGACTQLTDITDKDAEDYSAIADVGALSPYTTTSATWPREWPWKPDVVVEGGNVGKDPEGFCSTFVSLSLLTTHHQPTERLFWTTWATSAATALAANFAATLWASYPQFWPETVRAMVVHSARWTDAMLTEYLPNGRSQQALTSLLRHCGYGVPSLERALWSAGNSLSLIVQDALQPYEKTSSGIKTRDMHLHDLPWPQDALLALGNTQVTLRVTLSYFIEPNPGERGNTDKYAYQSHALRFAVRRPLETEAQFRARINLRAQEEEAGLPGSSAGDGGWFLGRLRARGSILSDSWTGSAAELANRGQLAVFPAMGWWRNRPAVGRFDRTARYALVVSIEAPTVEQDLYAVVEHLIAQTQIAAAVAT